MSELCREHTFPTQGLACIACWQKEKIDALGKENQRMRDALGTLNFTDERIIAFMQKTPSNSIIGVLKAVASIANEALNPPPPSNEPLTDGGSKTQ